MILNVARELKQLNGQPIQDVGTDGKATPATVRHVLVNALMQPKEKDLGMEKMKKYELATRIFKNDSVELDANEVAMLKNLVGELFAPLVVGQVWNLLEGK